ncbi:YjcZ family sporulation protein [Fictibacillus iocasae]|uniref:YjcZ family sporulation protein n=1 Tax=Fictibacillus iocasae TaxID=2715437 RepID=A0ABW2NRT2_9BACL
MGKYYSKNFTLYVVLFILLVIVGAVTCGGGCNYGGVVCYPAYGYMSAYPGYWT